MSAFESSVAGLSAQAIIEACQRFRDGLVEGQSLDYAPATARFAAEARRRQEFIDAKKVATRSLPAPRYFPGPLAPFQVRQQKRLAENAHLPILFENITYDQWRKMSLAKEIPVGAKWVGTLGIVYGPAPKQQAAAE
ncbi:hypothetical protein LB545_07700 [Mesorhizobium sp. BR1-1-6]|uniref:hypothetical protein n=1 Tax=Mesorhizobium sp. BR1-1-6 TaxID=2876648 RepID=UPI001CD0A229|nr:hypothetical protein [Mesorhizobium sp. BR1-1-6]MBZ9894227.1 hypothetical protein [Mesorhizobium sp. BR1-1-6]